MAPGLERDTELLDLQEMSFWRQQVLAGAVGLLTAGPLGLVAGVFCFRKLEGNWLPWVLIGVVAAPVLVLGQFFGYQQLTASADSSSDQDASQTISQADQIARACALAIRNGQEPDQVIRNPVDGRELLCDPSYPTTVVVTSKQIGRAHV